MTTSSSLLASRLRQGLTPALWTRHVYAAGLEPIEEYVMHDPDGAGGAGRSERGSLGRDDDGK